MIIWLALFLTVIGISFLLALRSMKDYQEIPEKSKIEYGLYLIRQPLSGPIINTIVSSASQKGLVVSFERLFRGRESALCIFGPKEILVSSNLNLLELEDYANTLEATSCNVWEVSLKKDINPFKELPELLPDEMFLWQVAVSSQIQIRAGIYSKDPKRRKELAKTLHNLEGAVKIPRPFSSETMLNFYKQRSLEKSGGREFSADLVMRLLTIQS